MKVSIVIPNRNSPVIDQTLDSLKKQTFGLDGLEVIVAGQDRPGLVKEDRTVRFVRSEVPLWAPFARNLGVTHAQADKILFIDADEVAAPDWVELLVRHLENGHEVVGGSLNFYPGNYWALVDHLSAHGWYLDDLPAGHRPNLTVPGGNFGLWRRVFDKVGLFDEEHIITEDKEFFSRLIRNGYRPYFEPEARVFHWCWADSFTKVARHAVYYGQATASMYGTDITKDRVPYGARGWTSLAVLGLPESVYRVARMFVKRPKLRRHLRTAPGIVMFNFMRNVGAVRAQKSKKKLRDWYVHD